MKENILERNARLHVDEKVAAFIVKQKQPYDFKVAYAEARAWEFVNECGKRGLNYHVSVGGLDSITLFLFLKKIGIDAPGISVSMLEDKSIIEIHKHLGIERLRPYRKKTEVIREFGYPVLSKEIAGKIELLQHPTEKNKTEETIMEIKEARAIWDKALEELDKGTFWDNHRVTDELPFNLGPEGDLGLMIAAREADELADGKGKADVTLLTKFNTRSEWPMNCRWAMDWEGGWVSGTGSVGGWKESDMRGMTMWRIMKLMQEHYPNIAAHIEPVRKYSESMGENGEKIHNEMTVDQLWTPSFREVFGGTSYETMGPEYTELIKDAKARKRRRVTVYSAGYTFLRSVNPDNVYYFATVYADGNASNSSANGSRGLWFGFCIHRR